MLTFPATFCILAVTVNLIAAWIQAPPHTSTPWSQYITGACALYIIGATIAEQHPKTLEKPDPDEDFPFVSAVLWIAVMTIRKTVDAAQSISKVWWRTIDRSIRIADPARSNQQ